MDRIRPMYKGEDLVAYCEGLVTFLFRDRMRDNGLPYTTAHLMRVANRAAGLIKTIDGKEIAMSAGLLHDAPEDIEVMDVYNPFGNPVRLSPDRVYLNHLLEASGEKGKAVCYIVDLLTHRKGSLYMLYANNIYLPAKDHLLLPQKNIGKVLKTADRDGNTDPKDERNVEILLEEYEKIDDADAEALLKFYRKTKTTDAFIRKGDYSKDADLFVQAAKESFKKKQLAFALDNLGIYLPIAERRLLIEPGMVNGHFDQSLAESNETYDWHGTRDMMKGTYVNSLTIAEPRGIDHYIVKMMGVNKKAPEIPGYKRLLRAIREEANAAVKA